MIGTRQRLLAMVGPDIRRDLIQPMTAFRRLDVALFYQNEPYGDLQPQDRTSLLHHFEGSFDLARQLRALRPDFVVGVEPFALRLMPWALICDWAAWRMGAVRCHIALENRPLREKYSPLIAAIGRPLIAQSVRRSRRLYALNEGAARNLVWAGATQSNVQRLLVGTWGVDLTEFRPEPDGSEPNWPGRPVILYVGRLHLEKGILDLAAAFGRLREHAPNAQLVFAGAGPHEAQVRAAVEPFAAHVHFTGPVKHALLPPVFRSATLFVSPSRTTPKWEEQVGMTNIQAMACGVPVISTRTGAIPEYVPEGVAGLLVPERNPETLAAAMWQVTADEHQQLLLGRGGRDYAVAHYDAYENVRRFEDSLLSLNGAAE